MGNMEEIQGLVIAALVGGQFITPPEGFKMPDFEDLLPGLLPPGVSLPEDVVIDLKKKASKLTIQTPNVVTSLNPADVSSVTAVLNPNLVKLPELNLDDLKDDLGRPFDCAKDLDPTLKKDLEEAFKFGLKQAIQEFVISDFTCANFKEFEDYELTAKTFEKDGKVQNMVEGLNFVDVMYVLQALEDLDAFAPWPEDLMTDVANILQGIPVGSSDADEEIKNALLGNSTKVAKDFADDTDDIVKKLNGMQKDFVKMLKGLLDGEECSDEAIQKLMKELNEAISEVYDDRKPKLTLPEFEVPDDIKIPDMTDGIKLPDSDDIKDIVGLVTVPPNRT